MQQFLSTLENMPSEVQLLWLVSCLSLSWVMEALSPLFNFNYNKLKHIGVNLVFFTTSIIISIPFIALTFTVFTWVEAHQVGIFYLVELPVWLELLLAIMVLDFFGQYAVHYLLHHVKWLWRLHMVHHSDTQVDATTGFRHHPGDTITRHLGALVAILIFGIPVVYYVLYRMITIFFGYLTHANFTLPAGVDKALSYVLVTPDMHKFHHHFEAPWTDSNFGNVFSIWDRMFGTLTYADTADIHYGLDVLDPTTDQDIAYQYMLPFNKSVPTTGRPGLFT